MDEWTVPKKKKKLAPLGEMDSLAADLAIQAILGELIHRLTITIIDR